MKKIIFLFILIFSSLNLYCTTHTLKFNLNRINKSVIRYSLIPDQNSDAAQSILFPRFIPSNYFEIATDDFIKNVKGYDKLGRDIQIKNMDGRYVSSESVAYFEIDISKKTKMNDLKPGLHPMFEKNKFVSLALSTISPVFASKDSIVVKIKDDFGGQTQIDSFLVLGAELWKYNITKSKFKKKLTINERSLIISTNQKEQENTFHQEFISTAFSALTDRLQIKLPPNFTVFLNYNEVKFLKNHRLPSSEIFQNGMTIMINSKAGEVEQKEQILRAIAWQLYRFFMPLKINDNRIENLDPQLGHHSVHVWWYESVTKYLSLTALVGAKLIEEDYFRKIMLKKIIKSLEAPNYSLIQLANDYPNENEKIQTWKNLKSYSAFNNRGVLAAMMMDISLLKESRGDHNLNDQFIKLLNEGSPIQSTLFINNLTNNKGDLYKQAIEHYILGIEAIAFRSMFRLIDWQFFKKGEEHKTFIKGGYVSYFPEIEHYLCVKKGKNTVGLEKGDILLTVNGQKHFNLLDLNEIVFGGPNLRNQGRVKIEVLRNGQKILLRGQADIDIKIKEHTIMPLFQPDSEAYQRRLKLLQLK